jgi:hypothetical protein
VDDSSTLSLEQPTASAAALRCVQKSLILP